MAIVIFVIIYYVVSHNAFKMQSSSNPNCYTVWVSNPANGIAGPAHYMPCGSTTRIIGNGTSTGNGAEFSIAPGSDFGYHPGTAPTHMMLVSNELILAEFNLNYKF